MDYIFRWLNLKFPEGHFSETGAPAPKAARCQNKTPLPKRVKLAPPVEVVEYCDNSDEEEFSVAATFVTETDAPACHECGAIMVRSGACHKCLNCGSTSGCS